MERSMHGASRRSLQTFGYGVLIGVAIIACLVILGLLSS
jgi:NADH:ubiquinone oxidoreductase subunit H